MGEPFPCNKPPLLTVSLSFLPLINVINYTGVLSILLSFTSCHPTVVVLCFRVLLFSLSICFSSQETSFLTEVLQYKWSGIFLYLTAKVTAIHRVNWCWSLQLIFINSKENKCYKNFECKLRRAYINYKRQELQAAFTRPFKCI